MLGLAPRLTALLPAVAVVGVELAVLAALASACLFIATWTIRRLAAFPRGLAPDSVRILRARARTVVLSASLVLAIGILFVNGWLIARGVDVPSGTFGLIAAVGADNWRALALAFAKLAAAATGIVIGVWVVRRVLHGVEAAINRWDRLPANDRSLAAFFNGLRRVIVGAGWLAFGLYALRLLAAPEGVSAGLLMILRTYLVIAVGLLVVRSSMAIVDTLDGLSQRYAQKRGWLVYHDHLRPLLPTFRACLEYALWIALGSVLLLQLGPLSVFAPWGPKLIQAIGIFFLSRVVIELGRLEIGRRLLPREGLSETTRRRRETTAPLVRSGFSYAVYFGAVVLILASFGFNPVPFLAGAGILGLVVGFGAQSLINDVVSGFFILFENTYLVGDLIEAADAKGIVEAIEFRTTKIRDGDGRMHIIRNGDVKKVVNYSKEYTVAVVPVDVVYDADLRMVFDALREAAERLRAENTDVLAATEIDGIVAFGATAMTVRTATRVKPGRHDATAAALRLSIKEAFDRRAAGTARRGLVPVDLVGATAPNR